VKVFVSYAESDGEWAGWIAARLHDAGHEPFIRGWEIGPGENIARWMEERLQEADLVLALFSDAYCKALYSRTERFAVYWIDAERYADFVAPVEVRKVTEWPTSVRMLKPFSIVGLDEAEASKQLIAFLEHHRTRKPSLQDLAEEFAKNRVTDEKNLTPFQRRMMSGGA
jgi:TIR domain-containing protein